MIKKLGILTSMIGVVFKYKVNRIVKQIMQYTEMNTSKKIMMKL